MELFYYPAELSKPPTALRLKTISENISGKYTLLGTRHNHFPTYKIFFKRRKRYLYVRKYTNLRYLWVIGSNVSDSHGEIISFPFPSLAPSIKSPIPASSPVRWPDWINTGTPSHPVMERRNGVKKHRFENRTLFCLNKLRHDYPILMMEEEDPRRCNVHHDCVDGSDEYYCPIFTNPKIEVSLGITAGIITFVILIFLGLRYWKMLDIETEVDALNDDTETAKAVDRLTWIIKENVIEWEGSRANKVEYKLLHKTTGGVSMFLTTIIPILEDPGLLHKVATFVTSMEQELYNCTSLTPVLVCLRVSVGSNKKMAIYRVIRGN